MELIAHEARRLEHEVLALAPHALRLIAVVVAQRQDPEGHVKVALRADDLDFMLQEPGNGCIEERFFCGAFYVYRLRLDTGEIVHVQKLHTVKHPVGQRVQAYFNAGHPLAVFSDRNESSQAVI